MIDRKRIGNIGEKLALNFLEKFGYQLVANNYRYRRGEIDLIMVKEGLLVFVEVKTRSDTKFGLPEEFLSERQQLKIMETAEHYLEHCGWEGNIRFDIVAIVNSNGPAIDHFEDAY